MFYKMQGQEMLFQLLNLEYKEDFALWDNLNNRFIRQIDGVQNINDIKFMKQDLFKQRYPTLRKNTQYTREIIVYDDAVQQPPTQYLFGFKKTANDDLNKAIQNSKNLGINPLEVLYKLRRTGQGINTVYAIVALERIGLPVNVQIPQQVTAPYQNVPLPQQAYMQISPKPTIMPQSVQNPTDTKKVEFGQKLQVPNVQNVVVLNNIESQIYEASCDYIAEGKLTEARYIELWNECAKKEFNTLFAEERIKQIYKELYSKSFAQ